MPRGSVGLVITDVVTYGVVGGVVNGIVTDVADAPKT